MNIFHILSFFILKCYIFHNLWLWKKSYLLITCFDFSSSDQRNAPTSLSLERPAVCFCIPIRGGEKTCLGTNRFYGMGLSECAHCDP